VFGVVDDVVATCTVPDAKCLCKARSSSEILNSQRWSQEVVEGCSVLGFVGMGVLSSWCEAVASLIGRVRTNRMGMGIRYDHTRTVHTV
jgi:hypothetical protein